MKKIRWRWGLAAGLLVLLFIGACGGGTTGAVTRVGDIYSQLVTAADGGTVEVPSDWAIAGAKVVIPAGALAEDTAITIQESTISTSLPSGLTSVGRIVTFGPAGTSFSRVATITIPYTESSVTATTVPEENIQLYVFASDAWSAVGSYGVDAADNTVSADVTGFSSFESVVRSAGSSVSLNLSAVYNVSVGQGNNPEIIRMVPGTTDQAVAISTAHSGP